MNSRVSIAPIILAAATLTLLGCGGGTSAPQAPTSTTPAASVTESKPSTTPARIYYTPKTADFTLGIKITKKACFGSAGCNVTFHLDPSYSGDSNLSPTGTIEVTYEITGADDLYTNSFTISGGTLSYPSEEFVSTPATKVDLKATVTDVSYLGE